MDPHQNQTTPQSQVPVSAPVTPSAEPKAAEAAGASGMDNKKLYGIIGYIIPILFFLPLIDDKLKGDADARFHANQQLILLITAIALHIVVGSVLGMVFGPLAYMLTSVVNLAMLALAVIGAINAFKGQTKELPVIGRFKII